MRYILRSVKNYFFSALSVVTETSTTDSNFELIAEEPSNTSNKRLWLAVSLIVIIGASVPSILYSRKRNQKVSVMPRAHNETIAIIGQNSEKLYIIDPLAASKNHFFKAFNLTFQNYPFQDERRIIGLKKLDHSCSVVWRNNMLLFGGGNYVSLLNGCNVKHFD